MDVSGDVADLMVKESIQLTEASIKLLAAGSKNLAAFLWALSKDNKKLVGKTHMARLLREGKELKVFRIKESDLAEFRAFAKKNVLFAAVKDSRAEDGMVDLVTNVDFVSKSTCSWSAGAMALPQGARRRNRQKKPPPALRKGAPHHSAGVARHNRRARGRRRGRRGLLTPRRRSATSPPSRGGWPPSKPQPRA